MEERGEHNATSTLRTSLGKLAWAGTGLWGGKSADSSSQGGKDEHRDVAPAERAGQDARDEGEKGDSHQSLECDFDSNPTELYLGLLRKDWSATITRCSSNASEAKTWVSRREDNGSLRWKLLPIHAALIFKAPEHVIEALLKAYPMACQEPDDQGMLPLHLAFRNEATERSVNLLLETFPGSVDVKDKKRRTLGCTSQRE